MTMRQARRAYRRLVRPQIKDVVPSFRRWARGALADENVEGKLAAVVRGRP